MLPSIFCINKARGVKAITSLTSVILKKTKHQPPPPDHNPAHPSRTPDFYTAGHSDYSLHVYLMPAWQPFHLQPLEGGGRVISTHLWVTRSSGY